MSPHVWVLFIAAISHCTCETLSPSKLPTTETPQSDAIPFVIVGPSVVQLPQKRLQLKIVLKSMQGISNVTYYWEVLEGGEVGLAETTYTEPILTLVNLKEGKTKWRATVKDGEKTSFRDIAITILPPKLLDRHIKVHINPQSPVHATEGDQIVLDGQGSESGDGGSLEFEWKLLHGPAFGLSAPKSPILQLDSLVRGNYTFELTIKNAGGATDAGTIDVIVSPKRDDPPKAQITLCTDTKARSAIDVRLPLKALTLCANTSTDDYGIVSYKWFRIDNLTAQLAVDFQGSTTAVLSLTNLQPNENVGPYVFLLTVFDAKEQNDSAKISIMVNKAINHVPVPYAGPNQTISLPFESMVLTGSVKDDGQIVSYKWKQLNGPSTIQLINQDKVKCTAKGFQEGIYKFQLNVTDDGGLSAVSETFVNVIRSKNEPPVARAHNVTVYLPSNLAVLNGSESTDDAGIVGYLWTPHDDVPACISMLGESSNKPELLLAGLIPGKFLFDLTVRDHSEAENTTTVQLTVVPGEELLNSVEMFMEEKKANITYRLREKLKTRIAAAIVSQVTDAADVDVLFFHFAQEPRFGKLRVVFYARYQATETAHVKERDALLNIIPSKVVSGPELVKILRDEINMIQEFHIESIDTLFCSLDCSGHGVCSNFSKECICDSYWMPNLFYYYYSKGTHDCSWSMLYFGIVAILSVVILPRLVCCLACRRNNGFKKWNDEKRAALRRRKRKRFRRNDENTNVGIVNGNGKANDQSSSYSLLIGSDSLSSDTEIDQMKNSAVEKKTDIALSEKSPSGTDLRERFSTVSFD